MIRDFSFVELTVRSWRDALDWYREVLGFRVLVTDEAGRFALLQAGTGKLALKDGHPEPGTVLLAFEVADLAKEVDRLRDLGIPLEAEVRKSSEGYQRILLRDLDGYRLCIYDWEGSAE